MDEKPKDAGRSPGPQELTHGKQPDPWALPAGEWLSHSPASPLQGPPPFAFKSHPGSQSPGTAARSCVSGPQSSHMLFPRRDWPPVSLPISAPHVRVHFGGCCFPSPGPARTSPAGCPCCVFSSQTQGPSGVGPMELSLSRGPRPHAAKARGFAGGLQ